MIPVTGQFIQIALGHVRRFRQQPAAALFLVLHETLEDLDDARALRQQDRQTLADDVPRGKKFQLAPEFVMVALLCFLDRRQMRLEVILFGKRRTVDTLQHLLGRIAAPVCTGGGGELECLDPPRVGNVRPRAKFVELSLAEEGDLLAFAGVLFDELHLVDLALLLHHRDRFVRL